MRARFSFEPHAKFPFVINTLFKQCNATTLFRQPPTRRTTCLNPKTSASVGLVRDCASGGLPRSNDLNVNREEEASYQGFSIRR